LSNIQIIIFILMIPLSLCIGSFLNVVIYRLPEMMQNEESHLNLAFPTSHCPHCKHKLNWKHNIPVLSYIFLKGRCAFCKKSIAWHYPAVELISLTLSLILVIFAPLALLAPSLIFTWILISLFFIDLKHQLLPDNLTLSLLWLGLLVNCFYFFTPIQDAVIGAVAGYLVLWIIAFLFKYFRHKDGLGGGDMKLLAALGAWLGWQQLPLVVLISSILCLVCLSVLIAIKKHRADQTFPFGPFLIFAGWIVYLKVLML